MTQNSESTSAARIAAFLRQRRAAGGEHAERIPLRRQGASRVVASQEQRRVWLHCVLADANEMYNDFFCIRIRESIDSRLLERAFQEVVSRHEGWRTSFEEEDGEILQVVSPPFDVRLPVVDLRSLSPKASLERMGQIVARSAKLPFKLSAIPLWRAELLRLEESDFRLCMVVHHIISDGISAYQVFPSELHQIYHALLAGSQSPLPKLEFQYADYAEWQRDQASAQQRTRELAFWTNELANAPTASKLPRRTTPGERTIEAGLETCIISKADSDKLRLLGADNNASLFMTCLAAFAIVLSRFTGDFDQVIGTVSSTRKQLGTDKLLGIFINLIPLRLRLSNTLSFREFLAHVRNTTLAALDNELPFDTLVQRFGRNSSNVSPLFQVLFTTDPPEETGLDTWQADHILPVPFWARWDLTVQVLERRADLCARFIFRKDTLDPQAIRNLCVAFKNLLRIVVEHAGEPIQDSLSKPEATSSEPAAETWLRRTARLWRGTFSRKQVPQRIETGS